MAEKIITVELRQRSNYQFDIEFSEGMPGCDGPYPKRVGLNQGHLFILTSAIENELT